MPRRVVETSMGQLSYCTNLKMKSLSARRSHIQYKVYYIHSISDEGGSNDEIR